MKYREALQEGTLLLAQQDIAEASLDAWCLLEYCTGMTRTRYFVDQAEEMNESRLEEYRKLLAKRAQHIPLQHLTNEQMFMGFCFYVNEHVLIPRQDTEILVEESLRHITPGMRILDLCTGSGCIAVSIRKLADKSCQVEAADISEQALAVARRNASSLDAPVIFHQGDLLDAVEGMFDCIVSNPPYIASKEVDRLMPEVRDHEPRLALDGTEDGLYFYRKIIKESQRFLNPGGWILFEIGFDQGEAVSGLLHDEGFELIECKKDLAGLDRVVLGRRKDV